MTTTQLALDFPAADAAGRDGGLPLPAKALGPTNDSPEGQTCRPVATAPQRKSRSTDPATSKRAALAAAPRAGSQRARILDAILDSPAGLTYDGAAQATGIVGVSTSTRISELARDGLIEKSGERETEAGGMATVWVASAEVRGSLAA